MTIKRLDPWSVLKFGAFASVVLYAVFLLVAGVVWFIIDRLQLVDQACDIALDVGFTSCGVNAGNLFQVLALLGGMWVIVQTAILVFLAFLYNLIADLTGGLVIGVVDDVSEGTPAPRPAGSITANSPPPGRTGSTSAGGPQDGGNPARTNAVVPATRSELASSERSRTGHLHGQVGSTASRAPARPGAASGEESLFS
ncbi:MAG: hypothetical protein EA340_00390 [Nitriliruptor sp.]|nr:MAG: hypothetical protein EA340_00390 [Nitriliruptor sp.]